jgi:excisionase family DNA binding protein
MRATETEGADLLTVREAGAILRVSPPTMYRLIPSGEIPAARVGKALSIRRVELDAVLARPGDQRRA